jgi:hypothetical protein
MLHHDQWIIKEIRVEITKFMDYIENENTTYQNLCDSTGSPEGKVYGHEHIY